MKQFTEQQLREFAESVYAEGFDAGQSASPNAIVYEDMNEAERDETITDLMAGV